MCVPASYRPGLVARSFAVAKRGEACDRTLSLAATNATRLRAHSRRVAARMLNAYELEVIGKADAVLGAPKQLELRVSGWAPGAADKPVGFEEAVSPQMQELSRSAARQLETSMAELADSQARLQAAQEASRAQGVADPQLQGLGPGGATSTPEGLGDFVQRVTGASARRQANPPPAHVMQLAERLAAPLPAQERQAVMAEMLRALQATGLSNEDAMEDMTALTMDASLRGLSSMFGIQPGIAPPADAAARPRAASVAAELRCCALPSCSAREERARHFKRCAACRTVVYCGTDHHQEHWPSHKAACKAARKRNAAAADATAS